MRTIKIVESSGAPPAPDLNLEHLKAQMERVDVLLRRQARCWQLAGQDSTDAFHDLYISDATAEALLARPLASSWKQQVALPTAEADAFAQALERAERQIEQMSALAKQQGQTLRLEHLTKTLGLNRFDLEAFLICSAPSLDVRYERLFGYLQDDATRKHASVNMVLDLLCGAGLERLRTCARLSDDAPLCKYYLLERASEPGALKPPLLSQALIPDETVAAWLLGNEADHGTHVILTRPEENQTDRLLSAEAWPQLEPVLNSHPLLVFYGPDQASQQAAAHSLATQSMRPLLTLDMAGVVKSGEPPLRALRLMLRDARLIGALPCVANWDANPTDDDALPDLFAEVCAYPDALIVASRTAWRQPAQIERERRVIEIEFAPPSFPQRCALWRHWAPTVPDETCAAIAGQFLLTTDQIRAAVAGAQDAAARQGNVMQERDLIQAARLQSSPRLISLARKIRPRYDWGDIVLPPDGVALLREIVATVRSRTFVLEHWGLGHKLASSHGVTILFAGPPGTGKTMAAEIVAAELGLDLYKIDLATIVSKYIGETEKNLERIFSEAENSNAILFFDEADALFGKRSEVRDSHDRYANIEISYLLQRMETYNGVTILATNLRANLDDAFTRRLQFAVEFPFPGEADQLRIWQTLFPAVPCDANLNLPQLAQNYNLAGGSIRNVLINAAYLAAADGKRITMEHLLHSVRRELQKMGRLTDTDNLAIR